jgi:hypothetical protein
MSMSEILPHREYIAKFLAQQEPLIGKIEAIMTNDGKHIDLSNMNDDEAKIAAEYFMLLGVPTFEGKLGK